jgi:hypothetical protein
MNPLKRWALTMLVMFGLLVFSGDAHAARLDRDCEGNPDSPVFLLLLNGRDGGSWGHISLLFPTEAYICYYPLRNDFDMTDIFEIAAIIEEQAAAGRFAVPIGYSMGAVAAGSAIGVIAQRRPDLLETIGVGMVAPAPYLIAFEKLEASWLNFWDSFEDTMEQHEDFAERVFVVRPTTDVIVDYGPLAKMLDDVHVARVWGDHLIVRRQTKGLTAAFAPLVTAGRAVVEETQRREELYQTNDELLQVIADDARERAEGRLRSGSLVEAATEFELCASTEVRRMELPEAKQERVNEARDQAVEAFEQAAFAWDQAAETSLYLRRYDETSQLLWRLFDETSQLWVDAADAMHRANQLAPSEPRARFVDDNIWQARQVWGEARLQQAQQAADESGDFQRAANVLRCSHLIAPPDVTMSTQMLRRTAEYLKKLGMQVKLEPCKAIPLPAVPLHPGER